MGEPDLMVNLVPEEYGGIEIEFVVFALASAEISRGDGDTSVTIAERVYSKAI